MFSDPRVSVVMTVYNGVAHLPQAIGSVLAQTFKNLELVIVDDASTDASVACIRRYTDPRIRLSCNERNIGQAPSLNRGLALARAPYVARLDQDDCCLPDRLQKQVVLLDARPDIAVVGTLMWGMALARRRVDLLGRTMGNYGTFVGSLLLGICPVCHPSVMFRREVVADAGGYDESFAPAEDVELWTKLALRRHNAYVIPEPLMLYRVHAGQQSVTKAAVQRRNIRRAQARMIEPFCPPPARQGVQLLLSQEDQFWAEYGSQERFIEVCESLHETLTNLQEALRMSPQERAALTRMMDRWLGPGVRLAPAMARWPSALFAPAVRALSPLLVPRVRPALARLAGPIRRLRGMLMAGKPLMSFKEA